MQSILSCRHSSSRNCFKAAAHPLLRRPLILRAKHGIDIPVLSLHLLTQTCLLRLLLEPGFGKGTSCALAIRAPRRACPLLPYTTSK